MPKQYDLGVAMHSYDSADTLPVALDSVLAQTVFYDPCVRVKVLGVVPDWDRRTVEIFKDRGVDVVEVQRADVVTQLNTAFKELDATFVQIAASDDFFYPNMFDALRRLALKRQSAISYSGYDVWENDIWSGYALLSDEGDLKRHCYVSDQCLIQKDSWLALGGFDESLWRYAFWDFFLRAQEAAMRFAHLDIAGFRYNRHERQISARVESGEFRERDAEAYDRFCSKWNIRNPITWGHGAKGQTVERVLGGEGPVAEAIS